MTTHLPGYLTPGTAAAVETMPYSAPGTPTTGPKVLGFVGLGNMGFPIAKNIALHHAQHHPGLLTLVVWNRSVEKAHKFVEEVEEQQAANGGMLHCRVADSVEELASEADFIVTSMGTDVAMLALADQIAAAIKAAKPKPRVLADTSTLYPSNAGKIYEMFQQIPQTHYVCAPVFGRPPAAMAGKLILCLGGDYTSQKNVAHLLIPAIGKKVLNLGGNVEKAASFKLVGNSFIVGMMEVLAETTTFALKAGINPDNLEDLFNQLFPAPAIQTYLKNMKDDNFDSAGGFGINGWLKDVHHIQQLASQVNSPVQTVDAAQRNLLTARALNDNLPTYQRKKDLDGSAIVAGPRAAAGLDPFDSKKHKLGPEVVPEPVE